MPRQSALCLIRGGTEHRVIEYITYTFLLILIKQKLHEQVITQDHGAGDAPVLCHLHVGHRIGGGSVSSLLGCRSQSLCRTGDGGQNEIQAVMTADIVADADQPMIGTSSNWFKGTFDGRLHKLTLNWTGANALTQDPSGLFARLAGTVQNLYVDGNVETNAVRTGVLVGRTEGASVIKNVITNVTLTVNVSGDCAASMLVSRPSAGTTEIANCIAMGIVKGSLFGQF